MTLHKFLGRKSLNNNRIKNKCQNVNVTEQNLGEKMVSFRKSLKSNFLRKSLKKWFSPKFSEMSFFPESLKSGFLRKSLTGFEVKFAKQRLFQG